MKVRNLLWILAALLVVSIAANLLLIIDKPSEQNDHPLSAASDAKQLYTCGMHPNVIQEGPGNCPICGMKLVPLKSASATSSGERKIAYWRAPMDPNYISEKPGKSPMGMDLVPVYEDQVQGTVITIDPATIQNIGVRTATVQRRDLSRSIVTNGVVTTDEARTFRINPKVSGWIEKLYVNQTGNLIQKGERLLDLYSPELVSAQEEYLLAYKGYNALSTSPSAMTQNAARDLLTAARERLKYWDITDSQIADLESSGKVSRIMTIYSPATGIVTHKNAVEGGYAKVGMDLFQIADLSEVWVETQVYEYELLWVKLGQDAMIEVPSEPGKVLHGKVRYIYPYLDPKTRTATVRLAFPNPNYDLKLDMYAEVQLDTRIRRNTLAVPREAVVRSGKRNMVFQSLGDGKFLPRQIQLGLEADGSQYEVLSGLNEGDKIVTSAQFLLDSEAQLQEALKKLKASNMPESSTQQVMAVEGQGNPDMSYSAEKRQEQPAQHQADHVASGATMGDLYAADSLYWCPMHHEIVTADKDARCPICNMNLVAVPADSVAQLRNSDPYGCVMDPVVRPGSEKDENCPVCGMRLTAIKPHPEKQS
jgi:Cu(I)/Ag(I) efflux system membrane fusion protein